MLKAFLQSRIRNKLGGYSATINEVDRSKPESVSPAKKVAVVGAGLAMGEFLEYDEAKTFAKYDGMTFEEFASAAQLPSPLRLTFNTFARAFFAPAEKLSTAELMKSFHFFYLSHDHGLLYDYFDTDYHSALLEPILRHLQRHNVSIRLNHRSRKLAAKIIC